MTIRALRAIVCSDGIDDAKPDSVTRKCDRELVGQDMILRFEIGGLQSEDAGEGGRGWMGKEARMRRKKLGQTGRGKRVLGGDVERWAGEAVRCRELGGEKERQEELSFARTTGFDPVIFAHEIVKIEKISKIVPLSRKFGDIARRDPSAKSRVNGMIQRADSAPSLEDNILP